LRYGFKAHAERISAGARAELGLGECAPLDPVVYANHLGVMMLDFHSLDLTPKSAAQLLNVDLESWSGMTLKVDSTTAILINPSHNKVRQNADLAHELAHFILKHQPASVQVSATGMFLLSDYSDDMESEADWLAAALLLPRQAIMDRRQVGQSSAQIAQAFGVSTSLCDWRLRMTGVEAQLRRRRA
jgi:Zn-dependent peptidase ImmA (M78 family)